jgi:hypothetical protein
MWIYVLSMKNSYLTILVIGGVFSATAIGLGIASFSRLKKERQRKKLYDGNIDKVKYNIREVREDNLTKTTLEPSDTKVKAVATSGFGLEGEKVRRVKRYKSDGKPIYE